MTNPTINVDLSRTIKSEVGVGSVVLDNQNDITINLAKVSNPTIEADLTKVVSVDVGNKNISIDSKKTIEMNLVSITSNLVESDNPFYFNGNGGNTYFKYNSTSKLLECWVDGVKQKKIGQVTGGDPFA